MDFSIGQKEAKEQKKAKIRPQVDSNPCSTGQEVSTLPAGPLYCVAIICRLRETDFSKIRDNRQQLQHQQRRRHYVEELAAAAAAAAVAAGRVVYRTTLAVPLAHTGKLHKNASTHRVNESLNTFTQHKQQRRNDYWQQQTGATAVAAARSSGGSAAAGAASFERASLLSSV